MRTRRDALAVIGATVLAGCSAQSTTTPDETAADESEPELTIPIAGLREYEEKLREYGPMEGPVDTLPGGIETSPEDIRRMLEETDSVEEERNWLAENTPIGEEQTFHVMNEYLTQKEPGEPSVQLNRIYVFIPGASGLVNTFTTVKNGELEGQPSIMYQVGANPVTDHPNQKGHEALYHLRVPDKAASITPIDVEGIKKSIRIYKEDDDTYEEDIVGFRRTVFLRSSYVLPGISERQRLRFERETAAKLYEGMFGNDDPSIITEGAKQYQQSEHFDTDYMVEAEITENGWEFNRRPDLEMGDPW